jgi:hypothetical protein
MQTVIGYKKVIKTFRRKKRVIFVPIYKDLGVGGIPEKYNMKELRRDS